MSAGRQTSTYIFRCPTSRVTGNLKSTRTVTAFIGSWSKLCAMRVAVCVARIVVIASLLATAVPKRSALNAQSSEGEAILTTLSKTSYPPLARQTRAAGDVELILTVKADGAIQSIDTVSGHPLLIRAAVDSAQHSTFECRKCGDSGTSLRLTYTFHLVGSDECCTVTKDDTDEAPGQQVPRVVQSQNHVTVIDKPTCFCDARGQIGKVRSLKCLYLWRCSFH
jgi:Gram-negative bacterial TonB protein C-terminal